MSTQEKDRHLILLYTPKRDESLRVYSESLGTKTFPFLHPTINCIRIGRHVGRNRWVLVLGLLLWSTCTNWNHKHVSFDCLVKSYQVTRSTYIILVVSNCISWKTPGVRVLNQFPVSTKGTSVSSLGGLNDTIEKGVLYISSWFRPILNFFPKVTVF